MTLLISGTAGCASAYRNAFRQPSSPEGLPNVVGVVWVVLSAMFCGLVEHAGDNQSDARECEENLLAPYHNGTVARLNSHIADRDVTDFSKEEHSLSHRLCRDDQFATRRCGPSVAKRRLHESWRRRPAMPTS